MAPIPPALVRIAAAILTQALTRRLASSPIFFSVVDRLLHEFDHFPNLLQGRKVPEYRHPDPTQPSISDWAKDGFKKAASSRPRLRPRHRFGPRPATQLGFASRSFSTSSTPPAAQTFDAWLDEQLLHAIDPYNCLVAQAHKAKEAGASQAGPSNPMRGALGGWPVTVKDNFCTIDRPTGCSSRMLEGYMSPFDAHAVQLLRQAGADIVAKTNCDEFGMGSFNTNTHYGPVINPAYPSIGLGSSSQTKGRARHRPQYAPRSAGGSSGGAAASVRARICKVALASDTGGSIRLPAAYCGVIGLKPSYGLISRLGLVAYAESLDTVGLLGSRVDDVAQAFGIISSFDERDPMAIPDEYRSLAQRHADDALSRLGSSSSRPLEGLRVGIPEEYFPAELSSAMIAPTRRALEMLREAGAELVAVSMPSTRQALSAYYVIASAEASSSLARYDGVRYGYRSAKEGSEAEETLYARTRSEGFGYEVRKRLLLGTYALTADAFDNYFLAAQRIRQEVQADFHRALRVPSALLSADEAASMARPDGVDLLLHPSSVGVAPTLESCTRWPGAASEQQRDSKVGNSKASKRLDSLSGYVQDILTVPASLAGLPAMSVPMGSAKREEGCSEDEAGWPVAVSLVGQWGCEDVVFRAARVLEQRQKELEMEA